MLHIRSGVLHIRSGQASRQLGTISVLFKISKLIKTQVYLSLPERKELAER